MSSSRNSNWRQRQVEKDAMLAAAEHLKRTAKTEQNFPTTMTAVARRIDTEEVDLATRVLEAHIKEEVRKQMDAYRRSVSERERRDIVNGVYIFRRGRGSEEEEYEDEEEEKLPIDEQFPAHGRRGYSSAPDHEGWRVVTKRVRRKHVMTNAELERAAALDQDEDSAEGDHNGDLNERNQRRDFY
jgi:hypothetical protein